MARKLPGEIDSLIESKAYGDDSEILLRVHCPRCEKDDSGDVLMSLYLRKGVEARAACRGGCGVTARAGYSDPEDIYSFTRVKDKCGVCGALVRIVGAGALEHHKVGALRLACRGGAPEKSEGSSTG